MPHQKRKRRRTQLQREVHIVGIDVEKQLRMTLLCMNRLLIDPGLSCLVASHHKASLLEIIPRRLEVLHWEYYAKQRDGTLDFNATKEQLRTTVSHILEVKGFLRYYRQDMELVKKAVWLLEQFCRFVSLRPFIAEIALDAVLRAIMQHRADERVRKRLQFLLARFLQVDGPTTENPLQEVLAPWKNDLIDKVLDAGLLAELLDERHYIPYVLVWKLMQLNLTHRPSSRHAGNTTSFTNIISLTGRVGHTHETYPFVVFQPEKWSQNLWMVYEYA